MGSGRVVKIIAFSWTTPALLAGRKTCTRRNWAKSHARKFHAGDLVAAYDRSPRHKGRQVATIRLTHDPMLEPLNSVRSRPEDYEAEGFDYMHEHSLDIDKFTASMTWMRWLQAPDDVFWWTVRFELVDIVE